MAKETLDIIECPYCKQDHDVNDLIEVEDLGGEFEMECENCGKMFDVDFYAIFHCTATKKGDDE
jgi:uncharacterized protein YbaR (Trm112 family)